jgi:hypothetical protein
VSGKDEGTQVNRWEKTGWFVRAKGSRHLFSTIGAIGGFSAEADIAWRGLASADYDLLSSLHREMPGASEESFRSREKELLHAARDWGLGLTGGNWANDFQLLADLQHYGTATRLIDVTSNPMTALWFACQGAHHAEHPASGEDGVLLAINTRSWPRFGRSIPPASYTAHDDPYGWELSSALESEQPFVVESLTPNDRLRAQEGYFIAGRIPTNVDRESPFKSLGVLHESTTPSRFYHTLTERADLRGSGNGRLPFAAVLVPAELKRRVLVRLQNSYNRRPDVLFPDFSGFLQYGRVAQVRKKAEGSINSLYFTGYPH